MSRGDYTVIAIIREPIAVVERFVRWYQKMGATRIIVYFDDPDDPALTAITPAQNVSFIPCTPDVWREMGLTPEDRFTMRQNAVYLNAYAALETDWALFVDGDEFALMRDGTIAEHLAAVPAEVGCVNFETAELLPNIATPPTFAFRTPIDRETNRNVYRRDGSLFRKRHGLAGHDFGKSFVRRDLNVSQIRQHYPTFADDDVQILHWGRDNGAYLLHFMCEGFDAWQRKVGWRTGASGYGKNAHAVIAQAQESGDADAVHDVYKRLHEPRYRVLKRLRAAEALHEFSLPDLVIPE